MVGVAVMTETGDYIFIPETDPAEGEATAAISLSDGTYFTANFNDSGNLAVNDQAQAIPELDGFLAIADTILEFPQTITSGVAVKSESSGYTETLKQFKIFWDGSTPVYLSSSSTALKALIVEDSILVTTPRGTFTQAANPYYNNYICLSNQSILKSGVNSITVTLKNNYGSQVSSEEVYILMGDDLDIIDNTVYSLPLQLTSGVTTKTVSLNYTQTLGTFTFYWDGTGSIWISGASTPAYIATNDTLILTSQKSTYSVGKDPQLDLLYDVTSIFSEGINTVTAQLKNGYGTTIGTSALYLIQN